MKKRKKEDVNFLNWENWILLKKEMGKTRENWVIFELKTE
jgi:hypothetical protein